MKTDNVFRRRDPQAEHVLACLKVKPRLLFALIRLIRGGSFRVVSEWAYHRTRKGTVEWGRHAPEGGAVVNIRPTPGGLWEVTFPDCGADWTPGPAIWPFRTLAEASAWADRELVNQGYILVPCEAPSEDPPSTS